MNAIHRANHDALKGAATLATIGNLMASAVPVSRISVTLRKGFCNRTKFHGRIWKLATIAGARFGNRKVDYKKRRQEGVACCQRAGMAGRDAVFNVVSLL
ncbi:MAG: hypothetical protein U9R74_11935 [Pseudomonadota bacterium]|nr:hypothetical protein [Pseudomonadota bacterium]